MPKIFLVVTSDLQIIHRLRHKESQELSKVETQQKNIVLYDSEKNWESVGAMIWINYQVFVPCNVKAPGQKVRLGGKERRMISLMLYLKLCVKMSYSELHSNHWFCLHSMLYHDFICYLKGNFTVVAFYQSDFSYLSKELYQDWWGIGFLVYNVCTYLNMKIDMK